MNKHIIGLIAFICCFMMTTCAQKKNSKDDYVVTIKTKYGDMIAILYDETPKHKENFIKLAEEHFFDSLLFHRVIKGFMIQGGDPNSKNAEPGARLGNGGPGYTVEAEFNPKFIHEKGALSAARLGDQMNPKKESSGSQFYVVQGTVFTEEQLSVDQAKVGMGLRQMLQKPENQPLSDSLMQCYQSGNMEAYQQMIDSLIPRIEQETGISVKKEISPEKLKAYTTVGGAPHLDGEYTVFGKIVKGLDVIDKIASQPTSPAERPLEDIMMTVTVTEMPKKKIEKEYGYHYPEVKE